MKDTLLSDDAQQHLWNTPELDYLTHVVFRMYENKRYGDVMSLPFSSTSMLLMFKNSSTLRGFSSLSNLVQACCC